MTECVTESLAQHQADLEVKQQSQADALSKLDSLTQQHAALSASVRASLRAPSALPSASTPSDRVQQKVRALEAQIQDLGSHIAENSSAIDSLKAHIQVCTLMLAAFFGHAMPEPSDSPVAAGSDLSPRVAYASAFRIPFSLQTEIPAAAPASYNDEPCDAEHGERSPSPPSRPAANGAAERGAARRGEPGAGGRANLNFLDATRASPAPRPEVGHGVSRPAVKLPAPPKFSGSRGEDVEVSVFAFATYLSSMGISRDTWVSHAVSFLEGKALQLWQTESIAAQRRNAPLTWDQLTACLRRVYGKPEGQRVADARKLLFSVKQTGSLGSYIAHFAHLVSQVEPAPQPEDQVMLFHEGLKPSLKAKLLVNPKTLENWGSLSELQNMAQLLAASEAETVAERTPRVHVRRPIKGSSLFAAKPGRVQKLRRTDDSLSPKTAALVKHVVAEALQRGAQQAQQQHNRQFGGGAGADGNHRNHQHQNGGGGRGRGGFNGRGNNRQGQGHHQGQGQGQGNHGFRGNQGQGQGSRPALNAITNHSMFEGGPTPVNSQIPVVAGGLSPSLLAASLPAPSLSLAQCDGHLASAASAVALVQQLLGVQLPAVSNNSGWLCPVSSECFLAASVSNQHSWLNFQTCDLLPCLRHYARCKQRAPVQTTACVWVRESAVPLAKSYLVRMRLVHTFASGTKLFQHGPALTEPVHVYFDYPAPPYPRVAAAGFDLPRAAMTFDGSVERNYASFLLDSGATHSFIDTRLAHALRLSLQPVSARSVHLANASAALITHQCTVRIRIQGYSGSVTCFVLDMGGAYDVILGTDWLSAAKAQLDFDQCACILPSRGGSLTLYPQQDLRKAPSLRSMLLSAAQVRRAMRMGARAFMVQVKPADESDDTPDAPDLAPTPDSLVMPAVSTRMKAVLTDFWDRFQEKQGLPPDRPVSHTIPTEPGAKPPFRPLIRLSPAEMAEVERTVSELLKNGLIEPSISPFGAPVFFVGKKDGSLRMVIDYRALNKITVKNKYPLPLIQQLMDQLQGAKVLSSLDLQSGYHQLRVAPDDIPKTAFRTHLGHFQFKVLSFGLCNAPATFQAAMNAIFRPLMMRIGPDGKPRRQCVAVYLDDILVFSPDAETHAADMREVLAILRKHDFYCKLKKCEFEKSELKFLGHLVGAAGIRVDPDKVKAVLAWPQPDSLPKLRSFLGLATYFRKFILGFAAMVAPLHHLTKNDVPYIWSSDCQIAFDAVKEALTSAPTLRMPDPELPYELICDASGHGVGAVLLQDGQPVAYESRAYKPPERNYPTT